MEHAIIPFTSPSPQIMGCRTMVVKFSSKNTEFGAENLNFWENQKQN